MHKQLLSILFSLVLSPLTSPVFAAAPAPSLTSYPTVSSVMDLDIAAPSPSAGSNSPAAASDPVQDQIGMISLPKGQLRVCDESTELIEDALLKCEDAIHENSLKAGSTPIEYEHALMAAKPYGRHLPKELCVLIAAYTPLTIKELFECSMPNQLYDAIEPVVSRASKYREDGANFTWSMFERPSNINFVKGMTGEALDNWLANGFFVNGHDQLLTCINCAYRVIRIAPWMNPGDSHGSNCPKLSTVGYELAPADPIARKKHYARHVHLYGWRNNQLYHNLSLELQLFAGSYGPAARAKREQQ